MWGGEESEEKEKGREKTPQDKETGTIWATGRKCHCLEFGPWGGGWGEAGEEGQARGLAAAGLRLARLGSRPGLVTYLALASLGR